MSTEITNKTEAYDYLYDVSRGTIEANEQQIQKAKEFVSDRGDELDLSPEISFNGCCRGLAERCKCSI